MLNWLISVELTYNFNIFYSQEIPQVVLKVGIIGLEVRHELVEHPNLPELIPQKIVKLNAPKTPNVIGLHGLVQIVGSLKRKDRQKIMTVDATMVQQDQKDVPV